MYKFDWGQFNPRMGLIFMTGCLVVFSLMGQFEFSVVAGGISALLAWLTIILAPGEKYSRHLLGLVIYTLGGIGLTLLADAMLPHEWGRLASMGVVTFFGYLLLLRGAHPFAIGWCLAYWYLLVPLFFAEGSTGAVLLGHVVGSVLVIGLNLMKPVWTHATKSALESPRDEDDREGNDGQAPEEPISVGFAVRYAAIVSIAIFAGLTAGARWLVTDPTLIANATINMISPNLRQTWYSAVERLTLGTAGLLCGFYFGWYFPQPWIGYAVTIVFSFLCMSLIYVNFALLVGALFFLIAYFWGTMQSDAAHLIGNEKLISEFLGVAIAVVAIAILNWLQKRSSRRPSL